MKPKFTSKKDIEKIFTQGGGNTIHTKNILTDVIKPLLGHDKEAVKLKREIDSKYKPLKEGLKLIKERLKRD